MTDDESYTLGLQLTVILLIVFLIATKLVSDHPYWFGDSDTAIAANLDSMK